MVIESVESATAEKLGTAAATAFQVVITVTNVLKKFTED